MSISPDQPARALVIDESQEARSLASAVASAVGFEAVEAGNEEEAFARLLEHNGEIELILVDWDRSLADGADFVRRVRDAQAFATVSILIVTAAADAEQIALGLVAGADDYLNRPFNEQMLRAKLVLLGLLDGPA